ncbi:MAG TPA: leucine--tRNA ligase [Patescibacteria group bacterium]
MKKNDSKIKEFKAKEANTTYSPSPIELKWQSKWEEEGVYQPDLNNAKRPFYNLMMFPYPSAEGLHIGSIFTFGGVDVYARFKRMQGFDVFEPIGLDGFGIHSENHALKTGTHPFEHAKTTEANFYRQLHSTGISYAWKNKLETYDPAYYKWTQWLFIELFKAGLAYKKKSPVNFCPSCKTVLADEQVIDGKCERCSSIVEKRDLEQWFFKITEYADRLLGNIEKLNWTEKVKIAQRNWIGKKTGISIRYKVAEDESEIEVFTTRPDTNFGATFIALAPEHPLAMKVTTPENQGAVKAYIEATKQKSELERTTEGKEKTGVFTGSDCINPLNNEKMPIWISDFVLAGFGTGALVGVPGHDKRDFEFARKFKINIKRVLVGKDGDVSPIDALDKVQEEEGTMVNSDFLNGREIHEAMDQIMDHIERQGYGQRTATYHLRDWLISRQRYWGPPIPMLYCAACAQSGKSWFDTEEAKKELKTSNPVIDVAGWYPVPEKDLPVKLPYLEDYKPIGSPAGQGSEQVGQAPLARHPEFYETKCPQCGGKAVRETDVSDTFLDSAWYFLRYLATDWDDLPFPSIKLARIKDKESRIKDSEARAKFLPVTMYIGGAEHSVLHLLYSRFITMVLKDLGYLEFEEPFARFYAHGLIIKDGAKMSKSKGNVINPDEYIKKFGADAVRCYLLFLGPFNQGGDFRDTGMEGMSRFLKRVWKLFSETSSFVKASLDKQISNEARSIMHETIKGVTEDLEELRYNTALAKLMTWYNFLVKQDEISKEETAVYLKLFAPFAPHITEELYQKLRIESGDFNSQLSIHRSAWPEYAEQFISHEMVNLAVQVNGKLRGVLRLNENAPKDEKGIRALAEKDAKVASFLAGKKIKKVIYIVGKVINFVIA